jgi:hypothetical protein
MSNPDEHAGHHSPMFWECSEDARFEQERHPGFLTVVQPGVPGVTAGKFMVSGIAEKTLLMVIPIFASKNNAFEACCCT